MQIGPRPIKQANPGVSPSFRYAGRFGTARTRSIRTVFGLVMLMIVAVTVVMMLFFAPRHRSTSYATAVSTLPAPVALPATIAA